MATQPTKTQAKKTTQAARKTTQTAKQTARTAEATARQARQTSVQAERTVRSLVSDSAYAALGVGDSAVGVLRHVPGEMERIRTEGPKRVRSLWTETPEELQARLAAARKGAEKEFDSYAQRGRAVVRSVQRSRATNRAVEQAKVARSQVKAAVTSVRKAFGAGVEAVETASEKVGEDRRSA
jgi:ATP-dependent Clp protease ATP-binding subunit ClpA